MVEGTDQAVDKTKSAGGSPAEAGTGIRNVEFAPPRSTQWVEGAQSEFP
jgi:hypothetical protein